MRLLFVSHSFPPVDRPLDNMGGMQRIATELHAALQAHPEIETTSLLLRTSWRSTPFRLIPFSAALLWRIPSIVRKKRIEVVFFSSVVTAASVLLLRRRLRRLGARTAVIVHGQDITLPSRIWQRVVRRILARIDVVLPISRATGAEALARGVDASRMRVVPCGVDPTRFPRPGNRLLLRRALNAELGGSDPLPENALLLCSVGRQVRRKGFAWFVDNVMPKLPDDVHYWLAGDGPERGAIESAIARRGLQQRVRLLGRVPDETITTLYRGADLFVMPNIPVPGDMEGFGVVMLEAGLCGLSVVASRLEGIQEVVTDGVNGWLVTAGDADEFAVTIIQRHLSRGKLAAASERAAEHVARNFSWDAVTERYLEALRQA